MKFFDGLLGTLLKHTEYLLKEYPSYLDKEFVDSWKYQGNGLMKDLSVLQESPFTDKGSVVEVFTDLTVWMGIRKIIEQVNANAVAA